MIKKITNKKGFTLVEILIILAIIMILISVILVSIYSARVKAGDSAAFTSVKSTAPAAFMCLMSNMILVGPGDDASLPVICSKSGLPAAGYTAWPDLRKNGWSYSSGFHWCDVASLVECSIGSGCGAQGEKFCYFIENGSKKILCTQEGCKKTGF